MMSRLSALLIFSVLLAGCSSPGQKTDKPPPGYEGLHESSDPSRYSIEQDSAPEKMLLDLASIPDAEPRIEPVKAAGNRSPYMVFGQVYHVLSSAAGYREKGGASWYGIKFHGHKTSNGEVYDMYAMTAAHKTLPIPSYVKVTNLANGRSAIVRVNDRGPFHNDRIIDLSFAAASKLGYVNQGTAQVLVEAIDVEQWVAENRSRDQQPAEVSQTREINKVQDAWLQVGAYSQEKMAQYVYQKLYASSDFPVFVEVGQDDFYRIRIGPVTEAEIAAISDNLQARGFPPPVRVHSGSD